MLGWASSIAVDRPSATRGAGFTSWVRTSPNSVAMAGLLAFAGPITFFAGAVSVMRSPTGAAVLQLSMWWTLYGASLWGALVVAGYHGERLARCSSRHVAGTVW